MTEAAPAITTFQMTSGGVGNVAESVNLYRGDVNLALDLISLPGPHGLGVKVTALYQSNVQTQVATWNEAGATSVLGVGWSLPYELIFVTGKTSTAPEDGKLYLLSGGATSELILVSAPEGGPWTYVTKPYQFWQILRYFETSQGGGPPLDYWQIVKDDGLTYTYGGPAVTGAKDEDSPGHSAQWGICWDNWIGPSQAGSPYSYVVAWNLSSIADAWGDTVRFSYHRVDVPLTSAAGALLYTQESHLKSIHDAYGRKVHLHYQPKEASEYLAPNPASSGYQDRYETLYLDHIDVRGMQGEALFSIEFGYAGPVDVLQTGLSWFLKRYLTSIVQQNESAAALPGMQFLYYGVQPDTSSGSGVHLGALRTITYPQGGTASYTFAPVSPQTASLQATCNVSGTPGVWHGEDYVVVTSCDGGELNVSVFTWIGSWASSGPMSSGSSVDPTTVQVVTASKFFAVASRQSGTNYSVTIFTRSSLDAASWSPYPYSTTSPTSDSSILLAAGEQFVVAGTSDSDTLLQFIYAWQDNPSPAATPKWQRSSVTVTGNVLALAAADDYVFVCSCASGGADLKFSLLWVSEVAGNIWQWSLSCASGTAALPPGGSVPVVFVAAGDTCASASYITDYPSGTPSTYPYTVQLLSWGADFTGVSSQELSSSCAVPTAAPFAFGPVIVANSLVASGPYLWRYDGARWTSYTFEVSASGTVAADFAYGTDVAFALIGGSVSGVQFDPAGSFWSPLGDLPSGTSITAADGVATIGSTLLIRSPQAVWQTPAQTPDLPDEVNLASVQNAAPAYIVSQDSSANDTYPFILVNGTAYQDTSISACVWVSGGGPGQSLAGPQAFVTYPGGNFGSATELTLYRVPTFPLNGQSVSALPGAFQVTQLVIDDGTEQVATYYGYDSTSATFDPSGTVAQYSWVAVYENGPPASPLAPVGCVMHNFFNGPSSVYLPPSDSQPWNVLPSNVCIDLLNGLIAATQVYDAGGNLVAWSYHCWYGMVNISSTPLGGAVYPGTYVSLLETVRVRDCSELCSVAVSSSDLADLDAGGVPTSLQTALQPYLVSPTWPSSGLPVSPAPGGGWLVLCGEEDKTFLVEVVGTTGTEVTVLGGVQRTILYTDDFNTGQRLSKTTFYYDSAGVMHTLAELYTPWYQQYDPDLTLNLLRPVIQRVRQIDDELTTAVEVTTWNDWSTGATPQWAPCRTFRQSDAAAAAFTDWNNQSDPFAMDGWLLISEVATVNAQGLATERVDAEGVHSSVVYGGHLNPSTFPVALFHNASAAGDEALFLGFEDYESAGGWAFPAENVLPSAAYPGLAGAHSGRRSLLLPGAGSSSPVLSNSLAVTPTSGNREYVLAFWANTASGYAAGAAYWQIEVAGEPQTSAIPATGGGWRYCTAIVDLGASKAPVSVTLACCNTSSTAAVLIDDVSFWPLGSRFLARVYGHGETVTARLGQNGETRRTGYDVRRVPVVTTAAGGAVHLVTTRSLVAQNGPPPASGPLQNGALTVRARGGGVYQDFHSVSWQQLWQGDDLDWAVQGGALTHVGAGADTLTYIGSEVDGDCGVRVKVTPPQTVSYACGISLGSLTVQCTSWAAAPGSDTVTQTWQLVLGGEVIATASLTPAAAAPTTQDWVLVAVGDSVLFYADGSPVFAQTLAAPAGGPLSIFAQDAYAFADIAVFFDPVLSTSFVDGTGKATQVQTLQWDDPGSPGLIVAQTVYDPLGRAAIRTKPALYSGALFGFQAGFVSSVDWNDTGVMTGDVATENPADEGYPYSRILYDDTPLNRVAARGLPGKPFAITDASIQPLAAGQHVTTYARSGTSASGAAVTPTSQFPQYFLRQATDPDGNVTFTVKDKLGRVTARGSGDPQTGGAAVEQSLLTYDRYGNLTSVEPPNGSLPSAGPDWETRNRYDFLGRLIESRTPDTGVTKRFYDRAGRLAFEQDANGAAASPPYVRYFRYDPLGRLVETGQFSFPWDAASAPTLQALAAGGPHLPGLEPHHPSWHTRYAYDGDSRDPEAHLFGRLWRAATRNVEGGEADVLEGFEYDVSGKVTAKSLVVPGHDPRPSTIRYGYDHAHHVTAIAYETAGDVQTKVYYGYNSLGQLAAVGSSPEGPSASAYAAYAYDAAGQLAAESIGGAPPAVGFTYRYAPPGWLAAIAPDEAGPAAPFAEELDYLPRYYRGLPSRISCAFGDGGPPGYSTELDYDSEGQLTEARATGVAQLGAGPIRYDPNGNILSQRVGGHVLEYSYDAVPVRYTGADRLERVSSPSLPGSESLFTYDPSGNVVAASGRALALSYDPVTGMTSAVQVGGATPRTVSFLYDSAQRRVRKTSATAHDVTSKVYVHGINELPLMELVTAGGAAKAPVLFVYGLRGLLAVRDERLYYVVKDHLGSTRVVVGGDRRVAAGYDYLPYGALARSYGPSPGTLSYLFSGQEFDEETGLYNFRARLYDASLGRFYSPDPAGGLPSPYLFAGNNPIVVVDPTGLYEESLAWAAAGFIALAILGIVATIATGGAAAPLVMLVGTVAGALTGLSIAGATYEIEHVSGTDWSAHGLDTALWQGAASGAISGLVGSGVSSLATRGLAAVDESLVQASSANVLSKYLPGSITAVSNVDKILIGAFSTAVATATSFGVSYSWGQVQRDPVTGQTFGVGEALGVGAGVGGVAGFGKATFGIFVIRLWKKIKGAPAASSSVSAAASSVRSGSGSDSGSSSGPGTDPGTELDTGSVSDADAETDALESELGSDLESE